ncbi:MKL/myocardin-like protein [Schistosoma japonicum]|uniref:MKL/myocardin-like protein n=1 Tax=Schistosoma japonicum TaxID=6182 RepID=A0A4Z2DS53_SCHJA|nr:MKL/myocardin-like protein [Schistosoma japonicum]TNN19162.1 MKL/myocardin-like protein [Schistosoma japonicum]
MPTDQSYRKSGSPLASTEVSSLQLNRTKNKEALEKSLKSRRSVKELVNQGILLNPSISHPDKVRQLQRAKTSDLLKRKIGQRPDRQYLISHHILRDNKPGTSPFILEQCYNLEKSQLKETLATKLISRPGSLELVEKGVLQVDPGVDSLIKQGSIQYPRVESVSVKKISSERLQPIQEVIAIPPPPLSLNLKGHNTNSSRIGPGKSRLISSSKTSGSRAIRDDTVVSKLGSLVFHQYCPDSSSSSSPSLANVSSFQQKQRVRELQQVEMLRLQDTARAHRLVEQELCGRVSTTYKMPMDKETSFVDLTSNSSFNDQIDSQLALSYASSLMSIQVSPSASNSIIYSKNQLALNNQRTSALKTVPSDSDLNSPSLAHLTLTQLKGECKDRNLPRVGSKMQLMSLLNPYRREILAKYFPNHAIKNERIKSEIDKSIQLFNNSVIQTQQHKDQHQTFSMNSEECMMEIGVNLQGLDSSLLPQTKPTNLCTTVLSSESTLSSNLQVCTDVVMKSNGSNVLFTGPCLSLRHSASAPFFPEISSSSSSTAHTSHFQIPSTQGGNISSTTLVPVTFVNDTVMNEPDQTSQIPISSFDLQFVQTTSEQQSFVCMTPNVLPETQASTSMDIVSSYGDVQTIHHNIPVANSLDNQLPTHLPVKSYASGISCGGGSSSSSTTLHQIAEMWLRIRQLRRNISQYIKSSQSVLNDHGESSFPGNLQYLQQEHNRLAVLCRLLIIERLDTLDEIDSSDTRFFESNDSSKSDFNIERNLLNSYLRRLGGSNLTDSLSLPNTDLTISSNNTSTLLTEQSNCHTFSNYTTTSNNSLQTSGISLYCDSNPMTPESRFDDHGSIGLTASFTSNNNNELLFTHEQDSTPNNNHDDNNSNNNMLDLQFDEEKEEVDVAKHICSDLRSSPLSGLLRSYTYDTSLEQLPSPMTTDVLFELWNSVVEDTSEQSGLTTTIPASTTDPTNIDTCSINMVNNSSIVTKNSDDLSNFYSVTNSNVQDMPITDNSTVCFSGRSYAVKNMSDSYNNRGDYTSPLSSFNSSPPITFSTNTSSLPPPPLTTTQIQTVTPNTVSTTTDRLNCSYSSIYGSHLPFQLSDTLRRQPVVNHQLSSPSLSSSPNSHSYTFLEDHPTFNSETFVHSSSNSSTTSTTSRNPRSELTSQFNLLRSNLSNVPVPSSNEIFPKARNFSSHVFTTNKRDTFPSSHHASSHSMNAASISQKHMAPTTELLTDVLFTSGSSFDDNCSFGGELMNTTTDSSSVTSPSFPVSLSLNWSIGT